MKKIVSLLLSLVLVSMMGTAMADTVDAGVVEPGAQLTIKIDFDAVGGYVAKIGIVTDGAPVEFVDALGGAVNDLIPPNDDEPNSKLNGHYMVVNMPNVTVDKNGNPSGTDVTPAPLVAGHVANLVIEVSDTATAGTYTVYTTLVDDETDDGVVVNGAVTFTVESTRLPGDVDVDGDVDLSDIMQTARYVYSDPTLEINLLNADMDEDGSITLADIMQIARIVYPAN